MFSATLVRARTQAPILSSGQIGRSGAGLEQAKDGPNEAALEAAEGLSAGLALGPLPSEIRLSRRMMRRLGEGDQVEDPVQLAVAAAIETHPLGLTRAGRDRGDAGQGRQGVGGAEPPNVANLADQPGRDERADPRQAEERVSLNQRGDPDGIGPLLEAERPESSQAASGELGLDPADRPEEPTDEPLVADGDEVGGPVTVPR